MECSPSNMASFTSIIEKQECIIRKLEETNKEQDQTILELQSEITSLKSEVIELQALLGLHSGNSSFPPSRDIAPPPKPVSLREKSDKPVGGQKNVKG
jgi:hypothetical protein